MLCVSGHHERSAQSIQADSIYMSSRPTSNLPSAADVASSCVQYIWWRRCRTINYDHGGNSRCHTSVGTVCQYSQPACATTDPVSATIFFYGHAMVFATSLLGVPMSSLLMDQDPWIPMNIGIVINIVSVLLVLVVSFTSLESCRDPDITHSFRRPSPNPAKKASP